MGRMSGKVCLVTGATSGIGAVTAQALAAEGATLVMIGRDAGRTEKAAQAIRDATGNDRVQVMLADLARPADVSRVAGEFQERFKRLDVLHNNAGVLLREKTMTPDGFEATFATNHLGYFQLTNALLDVLRRSAPSRVVMVASDAHRGVRKLDFENLQGEKTYSAFGNYCLSKLCNLLFNLELARRLEGTGVTTNAVHPGLVKTNLFPKAGIVGWVLNRAVSMTGRTPEVGAKTSIYACMSEDLDGKSGGYYADCKPATPTPLARDEELARKLWAHSEELVRKAGG